MFFFSFSFHIKKFSIKEDGRKKATGRQSPAKERIYVSFTYLSTSELVHI